MTGAEAEWAELLGAGRELDDREARGADGRPISRGDVVRVPEHLGALGVPVPERRGRVLRVYIDQRGRVLVDAWDGGARTFLASECRRSAARVEDEGIGVPRRARR